MLLFWLLYSSPLHFPLYLTFTNVFFSSIHSTKTDLNDHLHTYSRCDFSTICHDRQWPNLELWKTGMEMAFFVANFMRAKSNQYLLQIFMTVIRSYDQIFHKRLHIQISHERAEKIQFLWVLSPSPKWLNCMYTLCLTKCIHRMSVELM